MGLFSSLFSKKKEKTNASVQELSTTKTKEINIEKEIELILEIIENLGLLDSNTIEKRIKENHPDEVFDRSILKRLNIQAREESVSHLRTYYTNTKLGFGSTKIKQLRNKLNDLVNELKAEEKNQYEIVEELLSYTKSEIDNYERILRTLNQTIITLEDNTSSETELVAMIDYWTKYYKENELGYSVDITSRVNTMAKELTQLPYGGLGPNEVNSFLDACHKMIEEAKFNKEESNQTLSRINSSLFEPKKNRFLADLEILERKLQMVQESPHITDEEKKKERADLIKEFQEMNGTAVDMNAKINKMAKELSLLENGGLGPIQQKEFINRVELIITRGKVNGKSDDEIMNEIEREFQNTKKEYYEKEEALESKIQTIEESNQKTEEEKDIEKENVIEAFQTEMGHEMDYKERINRLLEQLMDQENGGYGDQKLEEFKETAIRKMKEATTEEEKREALRELEAEQEELLKNYHQKLEVFHQKQKMIEEDSSLTPDEKENELNEQLRLFKLDMGYQMNFSKIISTYVEKLQDMEIGGFGPSAIDQFQKECNNIAELSEDDKQKYEQIKRKYEVLRVWHEKHVKIFLEWKNLKLRNVRADDREIQEQELDAQIKKMLSFSPEELYEYYIEDANMKKDSTEETGEEDIMRLDNSLLRQMVYVEASLSRRML